MSKRFNFLHPITPTSTLVCSAETGDDGAGGGGEKWEPTQDAVSKMVNSAVTGHLKRFQVTSQAEVAAQIKAAVGDIGAIVQEAVSKALPAKDEKTEDGKNKVDDLERIRAETKKQVDTLKAQVEASEKARLDAEERVKAKEMSDKVRDLLLANGINPKLSDSALKLALDNVKRTDDGGLIWAQDDSLEPELPLEKGVAKWVGSEIGTVFKPAREVGGSGHRQSASIRQTGEEPVTDEAFGRMLATRPS